MGADDAAGLGRCRDGKTDHKEGSQREQWKQSFEHRQPPRVPRPSLRLIRQPEQAAKRFCFGYLRGFLLDGLRAGFRTDS
jgi:hypothetical protein